MSVLSRIVRPSGKADWIFIGFLGFAVLGSGWYGTQKVRYRNAMRDFGTCVTDGSPECAAVSLEKLRSLDPENVRTRIADAQMRALAGEADAAESMLVGAISPPSTEKARITVTRGPFSSQLVLNGPDAPRTLPGDLDPTLLAKLSSAARGEALLVAGDIAAVRGDETRANARWTEAAGIVDPSFVSLRKKHLADEKALGSARLSAELQSLKDEFGKLFELARNGDDGAAYAASALRARVRDVSPPLASQKLTLAINAADRCAQLVRVKSASQNAPMQQGWRPDPPTRPSDSDMARYPWMRSNYERSMQQYKLNLARSEQMQNEQQQRRFSAENEVGKTANSIIAEGQAQLDSGLALAARRPTTTAAR